MTDRPNIVWLTLDSVRQDHTTMGDYHRETTPHIQSIADESDGVAFSSCFAHGRASATSIPSILSGMYPSRHGTYYEERTAFPSELPLVSELLSDTGYTTAAVSNNGYASSMTNLDRGFDNFTLLGSTPIEILRSAGVWNLLKYAANIRRHSVGFEADMHAHSGAYLVNQIAKRRIDDATEPFFMYVHYNEPHRAYYPPLPYLDRFTDELPMAPEEAASTAMDVHHNLVKIIANGCELNDEKMAALKAMYDGEIAYTDDRVRKLYEKIQAELGETILVITADHGELFGEDDMLAHKYSLHNSVLNVPMVVKGIPGLSNDGLVQHSDIICTLLEIAGADTETIQGVDLREGTRKYAISQSPSNSLDPLLEYNPDFDRSKLCRDTYSVIQDEEFKYVQRPDSPRLYKLPEENTDVIGEHPEITKTLDAQLTEWLETEGVGVGDGSTVEMNQKIQSRLSDLGYLDHEM